MDQIDSIPRHRRLLYRLLFLVLLPMLIVFAAEIVGRVIVHYKYGVSGKSFGLWRYDEKLGAVHAENAYNSYAATNNYGFRNLEDVLEPKPAGAYRIVAYGGSTTFCYNVKNEEAWPIKLQALLRQTHHPKDQVLNGGAVAWSLGHAFERAQRELPTLKPDYVIIYSGINEEINRDYLRLQGVDLEEAVRESKFGLFTTELDHKTWAKRNLLLVKFLNAFVMPYLRLEGERRPKTLLSNAAEEPGEADAIVLENYLRTLRAFLDLIERVGAKPIFIVQAYGHGMEVNTRLLTYSRAGVGVARDAGAVVVDAQEMVDAYKGASTELFHVTGVHWSTLGTELLAEHIFHSAFIRSAAEPSIGFAPENLSNP